MKQAVPRQRPGGASERDQNHPTPRRRSPRQVTRGLAVIGSAAILSVYAVGYMQTRSAEAQLTGDPAAGAIVGSARTPVPGATLLPAAIGTTSTSAAPTQVPATPSSTAVVGGSNASATMQVPPQPTKTAPPSPTRTPTPASRYRDGTFTGSGTSRHGDIEATVVIQAGRIVSARVTNCQTRYPCEYVNPLVSEVLSKQSPPTDHVSGASDSSRAYKQAVSNALAQAS